MLSRDVYRKKALECVVTAETIRHPQERAAMLAIAGAFLKMAEHIGDRHHYGTAHRDQADQRLRDDS
jgi:hypothetical protein